MKTTSLFGLTATTLLSLALPTLAQQTQPSVTAKPAPKNGMAGKMQGAMPAHCAMMMQKRQTMESATEAQDAKLKGLTAAMDQASGDQKMSAMAAVIDELVAQRAVRQEMMDRMQSQMMGHMMEHMQQGGKTSMMHCPMMTSGGASKGMMGHDMTGMKGH